MTFRMIKNLCVGMLAIAFLLVAGNSLAGIVGSGHDFTSTGTGPETGMTQVCQNCHVPHNPNAGHPTAPLWNHNNPGDRTGFTVYSSATLNATMGAGTVTGLTALCLSCHDGADAIDNFGGNAAGSISLTASDTGYIGKDLQNDHPVSFVYQSSADGGDTSLHLAATVYADGLIFGASAATATMECASCHDIHSELAGAQTPGSDDYPLLRVTNTNSTLCLTCHDK